MEIKERRALEERLSLLSVAARDGYIQLTLRTHTFYEESGVLFWRSLMRTSSTLLLCTLNPLTLDVGPALMIASGEHRHHYSSR